MILNRTWQQFVKAKENKNLTLAEQKKKYADERRRLYKIRHKNDRNKRGTNGYYADKLLW